MPTISDSLSVSSDPAGAQVYLKRFTLDSTAARQLIGKTPIASMRIARGQYILYIEKEGYAPIEQTVSGAFLRAGGSIVIPPPIKIDKKLIAADTVPGRMTPVSGADYPLVAWARPTEERVHLDDYFIDKYWAELHVKAFRRLGGSVRVVVLDNLREGVLTPDIYKPTVKALFKAFMLL